MARPTKTDGLRAMVVAPREGDAWRYCQVGIATIRLTVKPLAVQVMYSDSPDKAWRDLKMARVSRDLVVRVRSHRYVHHQVQIALQRLIYKLYIDPEFPLWYTKGAKLLAAVNGDRTCLVPENWYVLGQPSIRKPEQHQPEQHRPEQPAPVPVVQPPAQAPRSSVTDGCSNVFHTLLESARTWKQKELAVQFCLLHALKNSSRQKLLEFQGRPEEYHFLGYDGTVLTVGRDNDEPLRILVTENPEL